MVLKSLTSVSSDLFKISIDFLKLTYSSTFHIYCSLYLLKGSKFAFIDPENRNGCCGMMLILYLNYYNEIFLVLTFDILIQLFSFFSISHILKITYMIDDFPAPVLPTQPIFSPDFIEKFMPFNTSSDCSRYLN